MACRVSCEPWDCPSACNAQPWLALGPEPGWGASWAANPRPPHVQAHRLRLLPCLRVTPSQITASFGCLPSPILSLCLITTPVLFYSDEPDTFSLNTCKVNSSLSPHILNQTKKQHQSLIYTKPVMHEFH